jgi:hypothetical protein
MLFDNASMGKSMITVTVINLTIDLMIKRMIERQNKRTH